MGGVAFGGGMKAKSIWKYHRYVSNSFSIFPTHEFSCIEDCQGISCSQCSLIPCTWEERGQVFPPNIAITSSDSWPLLLPLAL